MPIFTDTIAEEQDYNAEEEFVHTEALRIREEIDDQEYLLAPHYETAMWKRLRRNWRKLRQIRAKVLRTVRDDSISEAQNILKELSLNLVGCTEDIHSILEADAQNVRIF